MSRSIRTFRRRRRRIRVRRVRDGIPPGRGRAQRLPARARKAVSAELLPALAAGDEDAFWDPSEGLHGMFNLWSFDNIDAIGASGLGGGSLIYANVLLRKDEDWFVARGARPRLLEGRLRVLARHARRPRPALRPRRADDERPEVPARPGTLRQDAQDARLSRRRAEARAGLEPRQPRGDLRQRRRPGDGRRADQGGPARTSTAARA